MVSGGSAAGGKKHWEEEKRFWRAMPTQ